MLKDYELCPPFLSPVPSIGVPGLARAPCCSTNISLPPWLCCGSIQLSLPYGPLCAEKLGFKCFFPGKSEGLLEHHKSPFGVGHQGYVGTQVLFNCMSIAHLQKQKRTLLGHTMLEV